MLNRRQFLQQAAALGAAGLATPLLSSQAFAAENKGERTLHVYNIHTGEMEAATFWADGRYVEEGLQALDILVRDHRANQAIAMEADLYQHMYKLQQMFGNKQPLHIISGYRAPETNNNLRQVSNGVAKHSLHMEGRAMDIRIPGVAHSDLHKAALQLRNGGVGYYPKSGFVHIDTGRVRNWTA